MPTITVTSEAPTALLSWFTSSNLFQDIFIITLILVMMTILTAVLVVFRAFRMMLKVQFPEIALAEKEEKIRKSELTKAKRRDRWNKVLGLRPIEEEPDLIIDHEYDGIKELDNPTPAWFMALFYVTIVFGAAYLSIYHVFGWGLNQDQEYVREMTIAETRRQEYLATQANQVDEQTVEQDKNAETLAAGKAIFDQSCMACHGANGEGSIGPNLTDDYWLHGGTIKKIFATIKYGVPDKGMIPWEQQLSPIQIAQVSNYIISLHGTEPANAKAPQGELELPESNSPHDNPDTGENRDFPPETEN